MIHRILSCHHESLQLVVNGHIKWKLDHIDVFERYKSILVAKGFQQEYGVNYDETFASIANMTSIHYFIVVMASM